MILSDFLQDIALGDLKGTNLLDLDNPIEIVDHKIPIVIQLLNQSLEYIYTKVPLKLSEAVINLRSGTTRYYIDSEYAVTQAGIERGYIIDSINNPYEDDLLKIHKVFTDTGLELTMNNLHSYQGIHTPEYNCVKVSDTVFGITENLTVIYKAKHKRINLTEPRDSRVRIKVPASFNGALMAHVASMFYINEGGAENIQSGNVLYAKFRTLIEEIKLEGIGQVEYDLTNIKPEIRGFI